MKSKLFLIMSFILPIFLLVGIVYAQTENGRYCDGTGLYKTFEGTSDTEFIEDCADKGSGWTCVGEWPDGHCEQSGGPPPESCTPGAGDVVCTSADISKGQGSCTNSAGLTCTQYYKWICTNSQGVSYCNKPASQCAEPCNGRSSPSPSPLVSPNPSGGINPNGILCKTKVEPSEVGINNPSVCDRLHDYVLVKPNSAGTAQGKGIPTTCAAENHTCKTNADCPQNTSDPDKIVAATSNWCYGFRDGARCLQLQFTGQQINNAGCAPGEGSGGPNGCPNLDTCSKCVLTTRMDILPYYASNGWDTQCSNMPKIVTDWCKIDPGGCQSLKSGTCASACSNVPASSPSPGTGTNPSPSAGTGTTPSPSPTPTTFTVSFRVAENPTDLDNAPWQDYTAAPMVIDNFEFKDKTPGSKSIWVEFKDSSGKKERHNAQIRLLSDDPKITGCSLSFEGANTVLNLTGQNFGADKGKVKSNDTDLQIREWKNDSIKAVWQNAPEGQVLPVTLTNSDGQIGEGRCSAISQLALGAKVFCRAPSSHDTDNVDLLLIDEKGTKVKQKVKIDKEGIVQGLTQRLEDGRRYVLSLKAPKLIRRTVPFTAGIGAVNIPNFVLPIGDIFPADGGDGKINTLDKAELNRQWIIAQDATGRSGDFNRDGRVNSIDWACMRFDFNREDDPEPVAVPSPSPNPSPSAIVIPGASPNPSPSSSVSPNPSPSSSPDVSPSPTASPTLVPLPANSCQVSGIKCGNTTTTSITIDNITLADNGWGAEGMAVDYIKGSALTRNTVFYTNSHTINNLTPATTYNVKIGCYKDIKDGRSSIYTGWSDTISCSTK